MHEELYCQYDCRLFRPYSQRHPIITYYRMQPPFCGWLVCCCEPAELPACNWFRALLLQVEGWRERCESKEDLNISVEGQEGYKKNNALTGDGPEADRDQDVG